LIADFRAAFLSPAHREVLVLIAVQGLPYEEVARICGCKASTVKSGILPPFPASSPQIHGE
jgi:DNA-binding CsgD family transcriptional regulator